MAPAVDDIRGENDELPEAPTLHQLSLALSYEEGESAYYLECMQQMNFVMVADGKIYIVCRSLSLRSACARRE